VWEGLSYPGVCGKGYPIPGCVGKTGVVYVVWFQQCIWMRCVEGWGKGE